MSESVEDLAAWLSAVWGEEERRLTHPTFCGPVWPTTAQLLARIAADRKILARCMAIWSGYEEGGSLCELARAVDARLMMHDLASPYRDRPDFPGETLVERQGVEQ